MEISGVVKVGLTNMLHLNKVKEEAAFKSHVQKFVSFNGQFFVLHL